MYNYITYNIAQQRYKNVILIIIITIPLIPARQYPFQKKYTT